MADSATRRTRLARDMGGGRWALSRRRVMRHLAVFRTPRVAAVHARRRARRRVHLAAARDIANRSILASLPRRTTWSTDRLGGSGLKVPALSLGTGTFGGGNDSSRPGAPPTSTEHAAWSTSAWKPASTCSTPPTSTRAASPRRCSAGRSPAGATRCSSPPRRRSASGDGPNDVGTSRHHLTRVDARLAPPRHRLHRHVPAARLRCADAGRGDAVHARRSGARGQDPLHRRAPTSPAGT